MMRIARFTISGRPVVAVDDGEGFVDYGGLLESHGYKSQFRSADPERRLIRMMNRGMLDPEFIAEQLDRHRQTGGKFRLETEGLTPLIPHRPCKIICIARNWADHAREGGHDVPHSPVFFAKTENAAIGPGEAVVIPEDAGRVDHEGELAVIISRRASKVAAGDAGGVILGYTCCNDVTARELQHRLAAEGRPWFVAKSMDTFAPLGPWIVTRDGMEPLAGKRVRTFVNGEQRQDGTLDDMLFGVPELVEAVTGYVTLDAGDVIAVGTPPGVGPLQKGDEVAVEVDGVGRLVNPVS